jgi:hypothetical protein
MYSILNPIEDILTRAIVKIKKYDRSKYFLFFSIVEKYISDNKLIIGGNFANLLILDRINDNQENIKNEINIIYEIYSEEPKDDAIRLANLLFESDNNGLARYAYVFTKIPNKIYNLIINTRICCIFYKLPIFREINLQNLLKYQELHGIYKKELKLLCMGNFIQLINLYNNMNNPNDIKNLTENLINEKKLRELYIKLFTKGSKKQIIEQDINKLDQTIKVWSIRQDIDKDKKESKKEDKKEDKKNICKIIFYEYICNSNNVLIGAAGNYLIESNISGNDNIWDNIKTSKLQIITENNLEDEAKKITTFCNGHKFDVTWNINNINYINDNFLKKITIMDRNKSVILEIFNYGEYNAIGYHNLILEKKIKIKFGSIFILMLFNLIEEWVYTLLKKDVSLINSEYLKLSDKMDKIQILEYLDTIEYLGIYKDIELELKRSSFKLKRIHNQSVSNVYYPLKPPKFKLLSNKI